MKRQPQLLYRVWALAAPVALLTLFLPATVAAQHGGHGGSHSSGGHSSSSHSSGGHGGGHSSGGHLGHRGEHFSGHLSFYFHRHGYPYPCYGYPSYGGYRGSYSGAGSMGALDLDIWPGRTAVYDEGQYVGTVDDFDGFPDYLWLSPGTHKITLYLEGYYTVMRQYTVDPGQIARVREVLERGDSIHPDDFPTGGPAQRSYTDEPRRPGASDLRREPGRLLLDVMPADASVYLNGSFVGTGSDLAEGLVVPPGSHVLEVVRPDRRAARWSFDLAPGEEVERRIVLELP